MNQWLRSSLRKWLGIGHEAELNNTVERLVARVGLLEAEWISALYVRKLDERVYALENLPALPEFEERIASLEHLIKKPVKVAKR